MKGGRVAEDHFITIGCRLSGRLRVKIVKQAREASHLMCAVPGSSDKRRESGSNRILEGRVAEDGD